MLFKRKISFVFLSVMIGLSAFLSSTAGFARMRCGTFERELRRRAEGDGLSVLKADLGRPDAVAFVDHAELPFRVHVEQEFLLDKANAALNILSEAWQKQVVAQGYGAPLLDDGDGGDERIDVYLRGLGGFSGRTTRGDDVSALDGKAAAYAYIEVNPEATDEAFRLSILHEFAHLLQFSIDTRASLMFAESSAVMQEALASPQSIAWSSNLVDFQSWPNAPFSADGIAWEAEVFDASFLEYGAVLFLLYLDETYGAADGVWIRELWEAGIQGDDVEENEPDFVDALQMRLESILGEAVLEKLVLDFSTWRILVSALSVENVGYSRGNELELESLVRTRRFTEGALSSPWTPSVEQAPFFGGCSIVEFSTVKEEALMLSARVLNEELDAELQVAWMVRSDEGEVDRYVDAEKSSVVNVELAVPAKSTLFISICVPKVLDPDAALVSVPVEAVLSRLQDWQSDVGELKDAGLVDLPAPIVAPEMACGCQAVPARGGVAAKGPFAAIKPYVFMGMASLSLLMMLIRGTRALRRRKDFKGSSWSREKDENSK